MAKPMQYYSYTQAQQPPELMQSPEGIAEQCLLARTRRFLEGLVSDPALDTILRDRNLSSENVPEPVREQFREIFHTISRRIMESPETAQEDRRISDAAQQVGSSQVAVLAGVYDKFHGANSCIGDHIMAGSTPPAQMIVEELRRVKGIDYYFYEPQPLPPEESLTVQEVVGRYQLTRVRRILDRIIADPTLEAIARKPHLSPEDRETIMTVYSDDISNGVYNEPDMIQLRDTAIRVCNAHGVNFGSEFGESITRLFDGRYGDLPEQQNMNLGDWLLSMKTPVAPVIINEIKMVKGIR